MLYSQLQKLLTDIRLRHGNNLCTLIRKHLDGPLRKKLIYPFIKTFSLTYFRFIDNIFFIWTGSTADLENFLNELNAKHPSIKFEYKISKERISFLDTKRYIKNNKLHTKIFTKKTDCQTFVNINSEHPKSLKKSIPYSQAL